MITKLLQGQKMLRVCGFFCACALATTVLAAQRPATRIANEVNVAQMSLLKGSQHPLAQAQFDAGRMPANSQLKGMSIVFNRSAKQQAELEALIAAQQDPASPLYHQWLTPDQFAARFGMAQSDIDKVKTWLQQQGFSIDSVARSRNMIRFSGTAEQVERAFQTEMHFFNVRGEKHFAPATALSLPTAVVSSVAAVGNLDTFRPRPMHIRSNSVQPRSNFTSGVSGSVFLAPGDIKTIYNLNPLLNASVNGTGQSIVILGQSSVLTSDVENFQKAAGLAVKDPTMVIVPTSGGDQRFTGDESESDLDLEWSSAIAPGADIFFVYTGSNSNYGVFDSLQYAVDEKLGNIISISYGACETNVLTQTTALNNLEAILSQAASQGQTVLAASGDAGSTACYISSTTTNPTLATQEGLSVSYPASSQYVTGVGGTEISQVNAAYYTNGSAYWKAETSGTDILSSALQYIPEVVWNDDLAAVQGGSTSLSAGGGGVSKIYTTKPSWQTGVPGIPSDNARDVPDISLLSSPAFVPYLYCSSDTAAWSQGQTASCSNSTFRDPSQNLTLAGGTSFATPVFAGMLAILNQQKGYTTGQGLLNTELYKLAANSTTYSTVFHDITSGNNACPSSLGANFCSGDATTKYAAAAGYDLATGLGSFNMDNLAAAWPAATTTLVATKTTISAATTSPGVGASDVISITVAGGPGIPTGTVNLSIDGSGSAYGSSGSTTTPVTLSASGTATYTANFATCGVHTIVARYAGDATHAPSSGSVTVTAGSTTACGFTIGLTPATLTVKQGSQGSETLTVTPGSAYSGKVDLSYITSNETALTNLCVFAGTGINSDGSINVASSAAVSGQITIDTKASDCTSAGALQAHGLRVIPHGTSSEKPSKNAPKKNNRVPVGMAFVGLLLAGFLGRSSRKLRQVSCVIVLVSLGLALSACGGGGGNNGGGGTTIPNPAKGTYTITFSGTDSVNSSATAQSSFSLVIN